MTDANVVLGLLRPDRFLGGKMRLDHSAAVTAVQDLARRLNMDVEQAAAGIINVVNEHMARALRVMSVQKGVDPRHLTLISFGGAGGLHVCALAQALGMTRAIVPIHAGVLSALGMLTAPRARHFSRTVNLELATLDERALRARFVELEQRAREELRREGVADDDMQLSRSVDLRYRGQSYALNLPWQGEDLGEHSFHRLHEQRYGHQLAQPVELVTIRVRLTGKPPRIALRSGIARDNPGLTAMAITALPGISGKVPVYDRDNLPQDGPITGPALITETVSTTFIAADWNCKKDSYGNLLLSCNMTVP